MTDGMSLGRQQAGQLAGTLTGPPERGHGIASGIRVNQSFQRLDQLGVVLDQRLPSSSRVPYSLNGERWLSKALDSPIDGRTRESGKTGDAGNTPSSQLLCIDGSDKVLLPLIQVRKQQAVFLLEFFSCAHTNSVTQRASFVTIINVRDLSLTFGEPGCPLTSTALRTASVAARMIVVSNLAAVIALGDVPAQRGRAAERQVLKRLPHVGALGPTFQELGSILPHQLTQG